MEFSVSFVLMGKVATCSDSICHWLADVLEPEHNSLLGRGDLPLIVRTFPSRMHSFRRG